MRCGLLVLAVAVCLVAPACGKYGPPVRKAPELTEEREAFEHAGDIEADYEDAGAPVGPEEVEEREAAPDSEAESDSPQ